MRWQGGGALEGELPTQGLWAALGVAAAGFVWTIWQYVSTRTEKKQPSSSPIGDLRVFGAALNDGMALHNLAEQVKCLCEESQDSNKHLEKIADELTAIRKNQDRQEQLGRRQDT